MTNLLLYHSNLGQKSTPTVSRVQVNNPDSQESANELTELLDLAGNSRGIEFKDKLVCLFAIPSPYIIKNSVRFLRGSNSLVSEKRDIYCINVLTNEIIKFSSLTECGKALGIDRSTIKKYLISGQIYNNYRFTFTGAPLIEGS